ncbi:hypothetical protein F5884DRAFT_871186 [Xylogone sp. PMI_703]|nr:hypothetical protein F5884DRAFT_871186 [Xylogone sp. PMI_703]
MTMAIDNQQRLTGVNLDHMPYANSPHFTNPWSSSSAPTQNHGMYVSSGLGTSAGAGSMAKQQDLPRLGASNVSMASYASVPITTAPAGTSLMTGVYGSQDLLTIPQDMLSQNRMQATSAAYGHSPTSTYATAPPVHTYAPTTSAYDSMGYVTAPLRSTYAMPHQQQQDHVRRLSHPSVSSTPSFLDVAPEERRIARPNSLIDFSDRGLQNEANRSFGDAMDASRGMIAMSQNATPRNIYGPENRGRGSADSYGFPSTHSTSSSISSGTYPSYFTGGSVDSSVTDYSNAGSDIEPVTSRTLPKPSGLLHTAIPPAPQSMMGQFSSKVQTNTQKKHKCKICDKRFTRPSSLQTHVYSHTGEKPFMCEFEGCGRHFSVVSNLRRHRKVHRGEAPSETGSEDHHSDG